MAGEEEQATFTLTLRDEISRTAQSMAGALDAARKKLIEQKKALGEMQGALRNLRGAGAGTSAQQKELRDRIAAAKAAIAGTQGEVLRLGENFATAAPKAKSLLEQMAEQPGAVGQAAKAYVDLAKGLGTTGGKLAIVLGGVLAVAAGAALLVTAVVAVGRAALEGAVAVARFGLAHADARRNEMLHLEALTRVRTYMGFAAGSASELQAALDRVSVNSALGRGELSGYAEQLYRMGLRGDNLSQALEGTAIAASTVGDAYARRFAGMAASAAHAGGSVRRLADDIRGRLGGIAARQAIGLDAQMTRLREGIGSIFDSIDIEPLLRGLNEVTSLFARGRVVSEAWGRVLGVVFRPFIGGAEGAGSAVRSLLTRFTTMVVRAATSVLWIVAGLRRVDEQLGVTRALGTLVFGELGIVATTAAVALSAIGGVVTRNVILGVAAAAALVVAWQRARSAFTGWTETGARLVDGLVTGIRSGYERVTSAVRGLASAASSALTEALEIRSPSRVFAGFGREIPRGLAAGVDEGTGEATGAVGRLAGRAREGFDDAPAGAAARGSTSSSTSIGPFYIEVNGGGGDGDNLEERLTALFERLGLVAGVAT